MPYEPYHHVISIPLWDLIRKYDSPADNYELKIMTSTDCFYSKIPIKYWVLEVKKEHRDMDGLHLKEVSNRERGTEKGFTLIELLIVLAILLVLSSFAMYLYNRGLAHAKETVCQTNLMALKAIGELEQRSHEGKEWGKAQMDLLRAHREHLEKLTTLVQFFQLEDGT